MRRVYYIFVLLVAMYQLGFSQREVAVKSMANGGVIDGLPQAIIADSTGRATALAAGQSTAYVLEPGGIYPIVTEIIADFYLNIKSSSSNLDDPKPKLVPSPKEGGGFNDILTFRSAMGGKLEYLYITGMRTYEDGSLNANRHNVKMYAGARVEIIGCEIAHDVPGAIVSNWEDGASIFLEDCIMHSSGHHRSLGGNGRILSPRGNMDTISIVNCSFFNFTDRVFRNMGAEIGYTLIDHTTILNSAGYHGGLQLGKTKEVIITNNIFGDLITFGSDADRVAGGTKNEQTQPEDDKMYVITIDTIYDASKITVRNNNIYWNQQYKDIWAANTAKVAAPGTITATLTGALGDKAANAVMEEVLTYAVAPPSLVDYTTDAFKDPVPDILAENFYFGDDVDLSYGTTAASYTAGDDGFPLGDLNAYPILKERHANGQSPVDPVSVANSTANNFGLKVYPNPFNQVANITFSLAQADFITLTVYNLLGTEVATLVNENRSAGTHMVNFDASNLSTGTYFYKISSGNNIAVGKMMLQK